MSAAAPVSANTVAGFPLRQTFSSIGFPKLGSSSAPATTGDRTTRSGKRLQVRRCLPMAASSPALWGGRVEPAASTGAAVVSFIPVTEVGSVATSSSNSASNESDMLRRPAASAVGVPALVASAARQFPGQGASDRSLQVHCPLLPVPGGMHNSVAMRRHCVCTLRPAFDRGGWVLQSACFRRQTLLGLGLAAEPLLQPPSAGLRPPPTEAVRFPPHHHGRAGGSGRFAMCGLACGTRNNYQC